MKEKYLYEIGTNEMINVMLRNRTLGYIVIVENRALKIPDVYFYGHRQKILDFKLAINNVIKAKFDDIQKGKLEATSTIIERELGDFSDIEPKERRTFNINELIEELSCRGELLIAYIEDTKKNRNNMIQQINISCKCKYNSNYIKKINHHIDHMIGNLDNCTDSNIAWNGKKLKNLVPIQLPEAKTPKQLPAPKKNNPKVNKKEKEIQENVKKNGKVIDIFKPENVEKRKKEEQERKKKLEEERKKRREQEKKDNQDSD